MFVHARQGRENFGYFLVLLQYCIIYIWTAVCLTRCSDYLTGFRKPLSTSYVCHTGLKTVYHNHWQSFGLFVIMMQWSPLYTLYDCHNNIRGLSHQVSLYTKIFMMMTCSLQCFFFVACILFHSGTFLVPSAQLPFVQYYNSSFGTPFSSEMSSICFFFLISSCQLFVLVVLFV